MKITVLTAGKIKEKYFTEAVREYAKRLSRYCELQIIETEDEATPDNASPAQETQIKNKEGARILSRIPAGAYVIALAIQGREVDSVGLSQKISALTLNGHSHLVFIIGGSLGLSDAVLEKADEKLSFSRLTFPHQLMRVILLEQSYRSSRIARGEPYHK